MAAHFNHWLNTEVFGGANAGVSHFQFLYAFSWFRFDHNDTMAFNIDLKWRNTSQPAPRNL